MLVPDKERERAILRTVYDETEFSEVSRQEEERPDFIIRRGQSSTTFGVEITELYESPSVARLKRMPGYVDQLLTKGGVRHKDDADRLRVRHVEIADREGRHKDFADIIIHERVPSAEYTKLIAQAIQRKGEKLPTYDPSVSHTNLVVLDTTGLWHGADELQVGWHILANEIVAELLVTPYREVFVITDLGVPGWRYIPLKSRYLVACARFFDASMNAVGREIRDRSVWLESFATFLCERGCQVARVRGALDEPSVILGNTGVGFDARGFVVFDLAETLLPRAAELVECDAAARTVAVHRKFDELVISSVFTFGALPHTLRRPPD